MIRCSCYMHMFLLLLTAGHSGGPNRASDVYDLLIRGSVPVSYIAIRIRFVIFNEPSRVGPGRIKSLPNRISMNN